MWKRWVALIVFGAVLAVVFVNLGEWQLRRLDERRHRNATVVANQALPPAPFDQIFAHPITDDDQWRRVTVSGTYDGAHQFQVRYRKNGDASGYEVVTPLTTASGASLLVDRGFVAVEGSARYPDTVPPAPAGPVTVTGFVHRSEQGKGPAINPVNAQVRLVNAQAIGRTLPHPVVDGYLSLTESSAPQQGGLVPQELPALDEGPHFSYAMQWFLFTIVGMIGIVFFIRADLKERRRVTAVTAEPATDGENDGDSEDDGDGEDDDTP